jgi:hypothetical protein
MARPRVMRANAFTGFLTGDVMSTTVSESGREVFTEL